jgi:hypothetical protein
MRENGRVSDHPEQTPAEPTPRPGGAPQTTESIDAVSVRRAPRYYRFMAVGFAVGLLVTIILTFAFPEQEDFNRLQVFGFVGLFLVALFVAIGALIAIVLDRASRKRARTVEAERIEEHDERGPIEVADFVQVTDAPTTGPAPTEPDSRDSRDSEEPGQPEKRD